MKKNFILCACAAAALMFASCQKETPAGNQSTPDDPKQEETTTPDTPAADMNTITATTSNTKVITTDGVNVLWDKGDKIQLYTRTWKIKEGETVEKFHAEWCDYNSSIETPSATATFVRDETNTNTVDNTSGKYLAIYSKGATVVTQSRDYYAHIAINKEQVAKNGGDFVSTILYAASEGADFTFSHAVSYLTFTVDQNTTPFTKLAVSPVNASEVIVSRIEVNWASDEVTAAPFTGKSQDSKVVTITTDDAAAFAPGTYYIAINPGTYAGGFKLTFANEESEASVNTPSNVEMSPGAVANMGTIGTLDFPTVSDKLGTLYSKNGVQGVVFWVNPDQPSVGKIVSAAGCKAKWGSSATYTWASNIDSNDGAVNSNYILGVDGFSASTFPAVYFCKNLGEGWYLPSLGEVKELAKTYYGVVGDLTEAATYFGVEPYATNAAAFDSVLAQIATDDEATDDLTENKIAMMKTTWYWTSNGNASNSKIWRVKFNTGYATGSASANSDGAVRCVRDVELD